MDRKRIWLLGISVALVAALAVLLWVSTAIAGRGASPEAAPELPGQFTYHGRLVDRTTGDPVPDGPYDMGFVIYDDPVAGYALWTQVFTGPQAVQVLDGLFTVYLGTPLNPIEPDMFTGERRWLGIKVGADPEMTPRTEFSSVPYALRAETLRSGGVTSDSKVVALYKFQNDNPTGWALVAEGRFHVEGDAHVQGTLSWLTRTARISIAPPAFQAEEHDQEYQIDGFQLRTIAGSHYHAPVQLPDGGTITKMTFYYRDDTSSAGVSMRLYRRDLKMPGPEELLAYVSSADGGMGSGYDDTISEPRVNNDNYSYYLTAVFGEAGWDLGVIAVVIEYDFTKPY